MNKKALTLLLVPFLIAGCSSDGGDGTTSENTSQPTSQPTSVTTGAASTSVNPTSQPTATSAVSTSVVSTSVNPTSQPTATSVPASSAPTSQSSSTQTSAPTTQISSSEQSTSTSKSSVFELVKVYLTSLKQTIDSNPFDFIPETMLHTYSKNYVSESDVTYDFSNHVSVSSIRYGGFGEQWHMVIENIIESQRFYKVFAICEPAINASIAAHNSYLDNATGDKVDNSSDETKFSSQLSFDGKILTYTLKYKTKEESGFFGSIKPDITMTYNVSTGDKVVRLQLSENNAMKFSIGDNFYSFGIKYGVTTLSRKAFFSIERAKDKSVSGKIYEYVQFKDKDLVPSAAEFYINDEYTSVVGNKASGMPGFTGFINELYNTSSGKLLGYEVREELNKWGVTATYHTLWFNLNNITGITSVKSVENGETSFGLGAKNNHDIYLNGSSSIFTPAYNKKLGVKTSRKYDVEMRKQFFYGVSEGKTVEYEVALPMMFIQANHDDYTNYSDFPNDMKNVSGITASVNLSSTYVAKIQSDYATLIDEFIEHKESFSSESIVEYIG